MRSGSKSWDVIIFKAALLSVNQPSNTPLVLFPHSIQRTVPSCWCLISVFSLGNMEFQHKRLWFMGGKQKSWWEPFCLGCHEDVSGVKVALLKVFLFFLPCCFLPTQVFFYSIIFFLLEVQGEGITCKGGSGVNSLIADVRFCQLHAGSFGRGGCRVWVHAFMLLQRLFIADIKDLGVSTEANPPLYRHP